MSQDLIAAIKELEMFYGGTVLNGGILEATWLSELSKFPIHAVQIAIARCFKNNPRKYNYFPSIKEIQDLARDGKPSENSTAYVEIEPKKQLPFDEKFDHQETRKSILIGKLYILAAPHLSVEEKQEFHQRMRQYEIHELEHMVKKVPRRNYQVTKTNQAALGRIYNDLANKNGVKL